MLDESLDSPAAPPRRPRHLSDAQWLSTKAGQRALRESILPALERSGVIPPGSAASYRPESTLHAFFRRLLAKRPRPLRQDNAVVPPDDASASSAANHVGYGQASYNAIVINAATPK